jgi:hypothetical protein
MHLVCLINILDALLLLLEAKFLLSCSLSQVLYEMKIKKIMKPFCRVCHLYGFMNSIHIK